MDGKRDTNPAQQDQSRIKELEKKVRNKKVMLQSKRERFLYVMTLIWVALGIYGIYEGADLTSLAAYVGSFSVYGGSYIIGESLRSSE